MSKLAVPKIEFVEEELSNGLKVILHRNRRVPLVHVSVHYRVGSSYESRGYSGFAHLFEHMMFQGSDNVGKNEHGLHIDNAGGRWNASTSKDRTNYFETVPSPYLDLALWLEADRMRSLKVTEENFENQRQTVIEEKKQSYDNRPYGLAFLRFDELAYENWAYAHSIIGSVEDLEKAALKDAQQFHKKFYGPGNAALVLSGDIDPVDALTRVEKFFGSIKDVTSAERPNLDEPEQKREKVEVIDDPLAVLPALILGYHMPELGSQDHYALSMAALILADGDSSRFYRRFVYDNNWIAGLFAGPNQYRGPQLFRLWLELQNGVDVETIREAVAEEVSKLGRDGVTDLELEKARNQVAHRFVARLTKVSQVGELLAHYASCFGEPGMANSELENYMAVRPENIQLAAERFLKPENRTEILVNPKAQE